MDSIPGQVHVTLSETGGGQVREFVGSLAFYRKTKVMLIGCGIQVPEYVVLLGDLDKFLALSSRHLKDSPGMQSVFLSSPYGMCVSSMKVYQRRKLRHLL